MVHHWCSQPHFVESVTSSPDPTQVQDTPIENVNLSDHHCTLECVVKMKNHIFTFEEHVLSLVLITEQNLKTSFSQDFIIKSRVFRDKFLNINVILSTCSDHIDILTYCEFFFLKTTIFVLFL